MSSIGTNSQPLPHAGCAGATPPPSAMPRPAFVGGGGFGFGSAIAAPVGERFASSQAGGVILDKDGAPAGRIPAGAFVDTKDGTIYGPDGKAITLPEGSTVDFFDLPDLKQLIARTNVATTTASGPATKTAEDHAAMMKSFVDGQWGPGGVTPMTKGGGAAGCDMSHASTTATTSVAGASGGGPTSALPPLTGNAMVDGINRAIADLMGQVRRLTPTPASTAAGGGGTGTLAASTGAAALGSTDLLRLSVNDLVHAVGQLNLAIRETGILGGGPGGKEPTPPPKTTPPPVEPPKTEVPSTGSTPSTGSGSVPPSAGSSST